MSAREVQFGAGDVRLSGTVWEPDHEVLTPGVVLVGGSGPADRTNGGYFDALRERLVRAGLTVLAFDKRGVGGSTGAWASAGVDALAADVVAAAQLLRAHPRVDRGAVGLFGHSEGGWVALRASSLGAAPRHLVLNSCPAVSFLDSEVYALTVAGVAPDLARAVFGRLRDTVLTSTNLSAAAQMIAAEPDPMLREVLEQSGFRLNHESYSQLRAWIDCAPDGDLANLRIPALTVYGALDMLTPVQASVDNLARLAPAVRTEVFPGADHRICIDGTLAPSYLDTVTAWCTTKGAVIPAR